MNQNILVCSIFCFVCIITSSNDFPKRLHLPITIRDRYDTTRLLGLCRIRTHLHLTSLRRTRDRGRPCYTATVRFRFSTDGTLPYNTHVFVHTRISHFPSRLSLFSFYALRACCQSLATVIELNKPQHFSTLSTHRLLRARGTWLILSQAPRSHSHSLGSLTCLAALQLQLQLQLPSVVPRLALTAVSLTGLDWLVVTRRLRRVRPSLSIPSPNSLRD